MVRSAVSPLHRAVAFMLAASLAICCCQVHLLLHAVSPGDVAHAAELTSCCTGCDEQPGPAPSGDQEPSAPPDGCKSCCIKGSGMRDGGTVVLDLGVFMASLPVPPAWAAASVTSTVGVPSSESCPRPEPCTLLRLRCALII